MNRLLLGLGSCLLVGVGGCAGTSGSIVPIGQMQVLPPTTTESVELLLEQPTRPYQKLAIVIASSATTGPHGTDRAEARAMEEARAKAASIGADAIVLTGQNRDSLSGGAVGTGSQFGTTATASGFGSSTLTVTVRGLAIRYTDNGPKATPEKTP